jgi:hypothetical protein
MLAVFCHLNAIYCVFFWHQFASKAALQVGHHNAKIHCFKNLQTPPRMAIFLSSPPSYIKRWIPGIPMRLAADGAPTNNGLAKKK